MTAQPVNLAARRTAKTTKATKPKTTPTKTQHTPDPIVARVILQFVLDGQLIASQPTPAIVFPVPPTNEVVNLGIQIDVRQHLAWLEAQIGPAGRQAAASGIWTHDSAS